MLKLNNITKSFPGTFEPVLKSINLELVAGDFCIIIGSNGSGKSTLLKLIAGEHNPSSGTIFINNKDYTNSDQTSLITQVVQDVNKGIIPEMTLLENMVLSQIQKQTPSLVFYHRDEQKIFRQISSLGIGLENYINQPLSSLSGGQKQMIATIMAINSNPQILLLDEHTSALDPKIQLMLMDYTAKTIDKLKLTTLMITHKMDDAIKYGNRLIMLHRGNIVFDVSGTAKSALKTNQLLALFHQYEDLTLISEELNDH